MAFPIIRNRRLRGSAALRNLVRETNVTIHDLIYPIFITHGTGIKDEISSMPGVYHYSLDLLEEELQEIVDLGIQSILVFGVPDPKGCTRKLRLRCTWNCAASNTPHKRASAAARCDC